jgi:hypothetical protein
MTSMHRAYVLYIVNKALELLTDISLDATACITVDKQACRISSSGMWHRMDFDKTDDLEDHVLSIFKVERMSQLGTTLAVTSSWFNDFFYPEEGGYTFFRNVCSITRPTSHYIPEDDILHSHRPRNLRS